MRSGRRSLDRQYLEREVQSKHYQNRLLELAATTKPLQGAASWLAVKRFMQQAHSTSAGDDILCAIFERHREDGDPAWRTILLLLHWHVLELIWSRARRLDDDGVARWANVEWVFLQVICRLDVRQRPEGVARKIFNDTCHDLRALYRSERLEADAPWLQDDDGNPIDISDWDRGFAEVDEAHDRAALLQLLDGLRRTGLLSEVDYLLLVGTEVYGRSLLECAAEAGLSYEAAKKRRQRAKGAIGLSDNRLQES
jgi:hypothetical protein